MAFYGAVAQLDQSEGFLLLRLVDRSHPASNLFYFQISLTEVLLKMLFGNLHWPFIKRSKISHIIERQCERERNYMEKKNKAEIEHVVKTMTQSHLLDIQEKDAEIASLKDHLERQQTRVQGAESIYLQAIHMQKQARRIATDIALQAEEATNLSIKFHQSMLQMCQSAENHEKEALSGFGENTKLLRSGK